MYIPNYQMHNVLNVYTKNLGRNKVSGNMKIQLKKPITDPIKLSPEGKRKATIETVLKDIFNKISSLSSQQEADQIALETAQKGSKNTGEYDYKKSNEFIFNVIDDINSKKTHRLSVEDTNFLIKRLEQLVEEWAKKGRGEGRSDISQENH